MIFDLLLSRWRKIVCHVFSSSIALNLLSVLVNLIWFFYFHCQSFRRTCANMYANIINVPFTNSILKVYALVVFPLSLSFSPSLSLSKFIFEIQKYSLQANVKNACQIHCFICVGCNQRFGSAHKQTRTPKSHKNYPSFIVMATHSNGELQERTNEQKEPPEIDRFAVSVWNRDENFAWLRKSKIFIINMNKTAKNTKIWKIQYGF